MENEKKVMPGRFVAFAYKLYNDANGELLFEAKKENPDTMIYGLTHEVIPGLVEALKGRQEGDKFEVTLRPEVAFGDRFEENVLTLEKDVFKKPDGTMAVELNVGDMLPMMTQEGYTVQGKVIEIKPDTVTMDFNHPFAGMTVRFDGELIEVRDAKPEELQPRGCGCGCHHDHGDCGDGCGDHCGDHCGCDDHDHGHCGCDSIH